MLADRVRMSGSKFAKWLVRPPGGATLLASQDGLTWENIYTSNFGTLAGLAHGNGFYLMMTSTGVWKSFDGYSWSKISTAVHTSGDLAYGNGKWISSSYYSTDGGVTWTFNNMTYGTYGNGYWFQTYSRTTNQYPTAAYSLDAITWTEVTTIPYGTSAGAKLYSHLNAGGYFLIGYNSEIGYSTNKTSWNLDNDPSGRIYGMDYDPAIATWYACGDASQDYAICKTLNPSVSWSTFTVYSGSSTATAIKHRDGLLVVADWGGSLYILPDGGSWSQVFTGSWSNPSTIIANWRD